MSLFMRKKAVAHVSSSRSRKQRKRAGDVSNAFNRRCRFEPLEKREYLAADPVSVGVVYTEQLIEEQGDRFYVAWVGGELDSGNTTLDSIVINLDKNGDGVLGEGEPFFDTAQGGLGSYTSTPFRVVDQTEDIGYRYQVEDGGMVLSISFTNFHAGDRFVFEIDLDEFQPNSSSGTDNALVEGGEMGGSQTNGIAGSTVSAIFSSDHYVTETWTGLFVDDYDGEYHRSAALSSAFDRSTLPYDVDDANEGIDQAGVYSDFPLSPKPITISGYVYADYDVDCNYDVGEDDPLSNVHVTLVGADGSERTTVTDVNGYYEFNDENLLPGAYQIFSESNLVSPEGWQYFDFCAKGGEYGEKISPVEIDVDGMQGGDAATQNNFAKVLKASVEGYVFEDLNDRNNKEFGESWNGVEYPAVVELYRIERDGATGVETKTFMDSQVVSPDGHYKFTFDGSWNDAGTYRMLPGRTYEIREVFNSPDYTDGKDYVGSLGGVTANDVFTEVFVGYGEHGVDYNFGELKLGSIAGNVYEDRNDNGLIDAGEKGIANVTVELYQWDGSRYVKIDETKTEADGSYFFDDLPIENEYAVREIQPDEYDDGKDTLGSLGGVAANDYFSKIEVGWDDHGYEYNFGELKLGSIAGNVYEDRNDNGLIDVGEAGIGSVTVELYEWNGVEYRKIRETRTAEDGSYYFGDLDINKEYAVREKQPENYDDGKDAAGSLGGVVTNDEIAAIPVQWDDHGVDYNFGELKLGSISGYVYHDVDDNGVREIDDPPIENVTVELYQLVDGEYVKINETKTDANGFYKFDSLDIEQTYAVKEIQPEGWIDGKDTAGSLGGVVTDDNISDVPVKWDDRGVEYNFGELLPIGSLSGYVYEDDNDNGVKDEGEAGIGKTLIQLFVVDDDGIARFVDSRLTDSEGYYEFESLEGNRTYVLRETQPTDYYDGKDAVGMIFGAPVGALGENDEIVDIDLPHRGVGVHYDFGELRPGAISGYVYVDRNDNGLREPELGEAGIPQTIVTLQILNEETGRYEDTGRVLATNEAGYYVFDNLQPSRVYRVVETQPANYKDGKDTAGTLGGIAGNDVISSIPVAPGDFGLEYNFGERLKPDIPDVPPQTPPVTVPNNLWGAAPTSFPYIWYQPTIPGSMTTLYGGGGGFTENYTWKLSVVNGGSPRYKFNDLGSAINRAQDFADGGYVAMRSDDVNGYEYVNATATSGSRNDAVDDFTARDGVWFFKGQKKRFGLLDAQPIVGDWDGDGNDDVGVFVKGDWYLVEGDWFVNPEYKGRFSLRAKLGDSRDQAVTGDWDGDGKTDIAIFGAHTNDEQQVVNSELGLPGDWNEGEGYSTEETTTSVTSTIGQYVNAAATKRGARTEHVSTLTRGKNLPPSKELFESPDANVRSVFDPSSLRRDSASSTSSASLYDAREDLVDHIFRFGGQGDVAISGDWNGDGHSQIGFYNNGVWTLDMNGNGRIDSGDRTIRGFGGDGAIPVVGDWDGDGIDTLGYFKEGEWTLDIHGNRSDVRQDSLDDSYRYQDGDLPVVGDFDGDGVDEIAVYRSSQEPASNEKVDVQAPKTESVGGDPI